MQLRPLLALVSLTLAATACGSDSKNPAGPGDENPANASYTATVSGGVSRSLAGEAAFAVDNTDEDVGFGMAMVHEDDENGIFLWRKAAGVLATGQHTVADQSGDVVEEDIPANHLVVDVFLTDASGASLFCVSTGGTFTVTSSTSTRVRGTFQFTATCTSLLSEEDDRDVTLTGTFDAVGTEFVPTH
jgi:hypothetical protein